MGTGIDPVTEKRRPDRAALVIALGLFVLAAVIAWDASRLGGAASYARIGPQTVPYVLAICLAGLGVWTVIEAWRGDFPVREKQEYRPVLWIVGGLVAQLVLLKITGFSIATGVMFGCVAYGLGRKPLWLGIPAGILLAAVVWMIFARGLSLTLPAGPPEAALVALLESFR
jgi:putative tricarboxylic transport membrane protein